MKAIESRPPTRVLLVIAGLFFCAHTLFLTLIPAYAVSIGMSPTLAGVCLALYAGLGIITDIPCAHAARELGYRAVIGFGSALAAVFSLLLFFETQFAVALSAALLGMSTSFLFGPILAALATAAGDRQHVAQSFNVGVQRLGALGASIFAGQVLVFSLLEVATVVGSVIFASVSLLALFALPPAALGVPVFESLRRVVRFRNVIGVYVQSWRLLRLSQDVRRGVVVNGTLPIYMIYGSSFLPLLLLELGAEELVAPALGLREVLAVAGGVLVACLYFRVGFPKLYIVVSLVAVLTFFVSALPFDDFAFVVLFSLQGLALGVGIFSSNLHLYRGTSIDNRAYAYACGGVVTRVVGLIYPVVFGVALDFSLTALPIAGGAVTLFCVLLYLYVSRGRSAGFRR